MRLLFIAAVVPHALLNGCATGQYEQRRQTARVSGLAIPLAPDGHCSERKNANLNFHMAGPTPLRPGGMSLSTKPLWMVA
jgi:hypothetical protein